MAGLGVSRNDSPFVFVQCAPCSWTCSVLVFKCASGRLCHLEKICFWAIIEGLFAGYAFCGFGFFGERKLPAGRWLIQTPKQRKLPRTIILRSKQPSFLAEVTRHFPISSCLSVCWFACLSICSRSISLCVNLYRQPLSVCNNAG